MTFLATALLAVALAQDSTLRLELNIPAYRLEAWRGAERVLVVSVAVGSREYRTPSGRFAVSSITWNPWWIPPASDWAANDTVTPPCPQNPVGKVKLNFAPLYFIHGTPNARSIGTAASHGCVRARQDDALALAELLVRHQLPDSVARAAEYAAGEETRTMRLPRPVPLQVRYALAEVRGDSLWLYPDIYRRSPRESQRLALARRALRDAGRDSTTLPLAQLRRLIRSSRRAAVAAALPARREESFTADSPARQVAADTLLQRSGRAGRRGLTK